MFLVLLLDQGGKWENSYIEMGGLMEENKTFLSLSLLFLIFGTFFLLATVILGLLPCHEIIVGFSGQVDYLISIGFLQIFLIASISLIIGIVSLMIYYVRKGKKR